MDISILNSEPNPIPLHAYAAGLAVLLGALQIILPKGTTLHRTLGYGWVGLMLIVSISSFWIHSLKLFGLFSPIHILSVITIWTIYSGVKAARRGKINQHKIMMILLYVLALLVTGAFTLLPGRTMNAVFFG